MLCDTQLQQNAYIERYNRTVSFDQMVGHNPVIRVEFKPTDDRQHASRRCGAHAAIDNTRQNLNPAKLTLAHHDPSYVNPPRCPAGKTGRVTI